MDVHPNLAVSTVATAPSPATSGTSLVVAAGEGTRFATTPPFNATIWPANARPDPSNAEIVRVTARSTDTLTITRAQESSSARTVVAGDLIAATITQKTLTDIEAADQAAGTASMRTIGKSALQAADGADTEYAFSGYRFLMRASHELAGGVTANTYVLYTNSGIVLNVAASAFTAFYLDPADYGAGTRTAKVRLRAWVVTNTTAPGMNFTFHLYPVATWGTPSANGRAAVATVGTSVTNAAINAPAANGPTTAVSADAAFPAAGYYVLGLVTSGTTAANSNTELGVRLDMRQV